MSLQGRRHWTHVRPLCQRIPTEQIAYCSLHQWVSAVLFHPAMFCMQTIFRFYGKIWAPTVAKSIEWAFPQTPHPIHYWSFKLCTIGNTIKLYLFILISVALTWWQGHISVGRVKLYFLETFSFDRRSSDTIEVRSLKMAVLHPFVFSLRPWLKVTTSSNKIGSCFVVVMTRAENSRILKCI